ncbi:MAG: hypothetical protein ABSH04_02855 [Acidimicrobiales bacterium]|jgi:hypothetical protein
MNDYLDQVEAAANDSRFYYLALAGSLVIPDICGALESKDGGATGDRYKTWFDTHVAPRNVSYFTRKPYLTGEDCYRFRCSFLHQGRTQHPKSGYTRILFIEPGPNPIIGHMNIVNDALNIDVRLFCTEMVDSARQWLTGVVGTEPYETNLNAFVRRYPNGLAPYIGGMPVIS